ncbi:50S ribosomal protein L10 [Candidatus Phytoplasma phoenicium]|uniref:Large ribosomal subunit protein uL10 n=1 Tax=Candidatus Phytoplasma phoenicium TaxID=198422 RepID=A0A2S8NVC2_9MOLU|nr:50S ribosomal protein L10 [Candidatus Phytoplasma phoenicium]
MLRPIVAKKKEKVNLLTQDINNSKLVVIFECQGLKVSDLTQLRFQLRKFNSKIKLYPNNIIRRAFEQTNYNELVSSLKYSKALLISNEELIEPAKVLNDFAKKNKFLKIISGVAEQKIYSSKMIVELSTLVSREQLLAKLSLGMLAPVQELAIILNILTQQK